MDRIPLFIGAFSSIGLYFFVLFLCTTMEERKEVIMIFNPFLAAGIVLLWIAMSIKRGEKR